VPPQSQPELRAQVLETRGWLIAQVMASDLTQPLVRFMQAPLPPGYPARSDALALINAVWRALALLIDTDQKRDLMQARLAYDPTFRTLAPDQRRLMRDNLLDGLFQYDKRAVGLPLVAKLAHLRQSGAALERRLDCCADLLCLGELHTVLDTETLTRAFDQMLAAYSEIDHAETRAHRIVDLARAVRAALTPPMFERLRDALLSIEGLRPASLADSKAERSMSLDKSLNGAGSPAQVFRRATQVTDLFAQLYEDGSDTVSTDLKRHSFFDRQLACITEHARLTVDEKDFIALNLRSLRAHHGIAD
jgi:hypothetical protein